MRIPTDPAADEFDADAGENLPPTDPAADAGENLPPTDPAADRSRHRRGENLETTEVLYIMVENERR